MTRFYYIADGYRIILKTNNIQEFTGSILAHLEVMRTSDKENTYSISTMDMSEEDFEIEEKNRRLARSRNNPFRIV